METRSRRILVVDNDETHRDKTCKVLRVEGHEVLEARTAATALNLCRLFVPDVAVIELNGLPDGTGYFLARKLKQALGVLCPRLVAVSTYEHSVSRARSVSNGFSHYLVKPYAIPSLMQAIETMEPGMTE